MPTDVTAITTTKPTAASQLESKTKSMGKDDFLKVFVAQMQHQDPSKPMDDSAFMGQMASFSTLEQISNMASANALVASNLAQSNAIGLLGRTVTYTDAEGNEKSGIVEQVSTAKGDATLTVDGVKDVDPASITKVGSPPVTQAS